MTYPFHILIADDNESLLRTMSLILGRKGYLVTTVPDGPAAIEAVQKQHFDLIFLDIKMLPLNGVETFKRIKAIQPAAVVFMMTAYAVDELIREALAEGAYAVFHKPLDIGKLLTVIEEQRAKADGACILIVDDDASTCATLHHILVRRGYRVNIARTGEEAIATARECAARNCAHDIILLDVKLPTINGLETYLAIREINPAAVVIMVTGYRQEVADLVELALHSSAYACLYKPFEMEELLKLVEEIGQRKKGGTDGAG